MDLGNGFNSDAGWSEAGNKAFIEKIAEDSNSHIRFTGSDDLIYAPRGTITGRTEVPAIQNGMDSGNLSRWYEPSTGDYHYFGKSVNTSAFPGIVPAPASPLK